MLLENNLMTYIIKSGDIRTLIVRTEYAEDLLFP